MLTSATRRAASVLCIWTGGTGCRVTVTRDGGGCAGRVRGSAARHYELGPIALALIKRTVPVDATLQAAGIAAAQQVIVAPDAGGLARAAVRQVRGGLSRSRE